LALAPVSVTETRSLLENVGKEVTVEGTIESAKWSRSGKVMNIRFAGVDDKGFMAALFERQRGAFDEAHGGDVAEALSGKRVRITGTLRLYGGRAEQLKGRPEIILRNPSQLEILADEPATRPSTKPSTQPATKPAAHNGMDGGVGGVGTNESEA
ncbi:MAG: hypothetical protein AAF743_12415, partial [Planctomycetota bacterium]